MEGWLDGGGGGGGGTQPEEKGNSNFYLGLKTLSKKKQKQTNLTIKAEPGNS